MRTCISLGVVLCLATGALADTFTATIVLPAGHQATPGEPLPIEIHGLLTHHDPGNDGLAYFSVDFALSGPQVVNLGEALLLGPPADDSMDHFVRPLGIDADYGGTAVGDVLVQAGGSQNTFGNNPDDEPFLEHPAAEFIVFNVVYSDQVLLEGTLTLPPDAVPGIYSLSMQNLQANVLSDGQRLESFERYTVETVTPITGSAVSVVTGGYGDLDGDGVVDAFDLAILLGSWGPYDPCPPHAPADFNQDCNVAADDLAILLGNWGPQG